MKEIRFHGRGGQGAVTAAELLAIAAAEGGAMSQAFPFFGVERTGAPVQAFCRIDDKPIRVHENVYEPDIVVVMDPTLIKDVDVCNGLKGDEIVIINSSKDNTELCLKAKNVHNVDATAIAMKHIGRPIVNTALLGAFSKVTGLVPLDALKRAIEHHFPGEIGKKNVAAIEACYNSIK
ncbi:MAG: pyruvate ferredoxin oxidoreductase subunit gamma [archaeon]